MMDTDRTLADPVAAAALGESRSRVLELLRAADTPCGVQEIAQRAGLHPNTARFHLDGLVEAGMVERYSESSGQIGRPRTVYRARPAAAATGARSYRLLAEMLTTLIAENVPQPELAATEAGRVWGGYLTHRPAPFERIDAQEAVARLVGVLAEVGFDPAADTPPPASGGKAETGARVRLRHCPFREVAERHQEVVCSLHLGLMQGALGELRAPVTADRLDPFVEPNLCIAHLGSKAVTRGGGHDRH
jgi:predicted ArsR family transcriptional regulator